MSNRLVAIIFCALLGVAMARPVVAPDITSSDWRAREAQFEKWRKAAPKQLRDEDRVAAMALLEREAKHIHGDSLTPDEQGEGYADYYINLALFVKNFHDPRSISALAHAIDVAGSISTTLAEFGDVAVDAVTAELADPTLASDAVFTLGKFVQGRQLGHNHLSVQREKQIRKLLLNAAESTQPFVRVQAARALRYFPGDAEVAATLGRLATSDPFVRPGLRATDVPRPDDYRVRKAARESLTALAHEVPK